MSKDYYKEFFLNFGNISRLETTGEFSYFRNEDGNDYLFPDEYAYNLKKINELIRKSVDDNHDYIYDLTKDVPGEEYKPGAYY